jgi:hypothetical protein
MEAARRRRATMQKIRENNSVTANKRRADISNKALQRRWVEDTKRGNDAFHMRKENEEAVMLRKMYRGLLSKMHEWGSEEQNELRQKVTEMKNEASWHIKSLQALFEDRVALLREQAAGKDDRVLSEQRQMVRIYEHTYVRIYKYKNIRVYVYIYIVYICIYVLYMYVYMYAYVYMCICICKYRVRS